MVIGNLLKKIERMKRNKIKTVPPVTDSPNKATVKNISVSDAIREKRRTVSIALALAIITAIVFSGVFKNDFINFDDNVYVTSNTHIQQGLSWEGVMWAFTTIYGSNWHPLTWISHMLDIQFFGLNPAGHHLTNLIFHILATLLLFGFLRYATGKVWVSSLVAALFALHPVHVESVAWVAERKDVLSAIFWFLTLWAYVYYTRSPNKRKYALVLILFAFGLLAKPMLVSLPFILLLLDYWPLERMTLNRQAVGLLLLEKIPLLIMAVASSIITVIAQQEAISGFNRIDFKIRLSNAILSYCIYLWQAFWPTGLAIFYPYANPHSINVLGCSFLLVVVTVAVLWKGRQSKFLITDWFWFIIALIPVIGIVQVGGQAHADRYTYLPFIGIFIIFIWGFNEISEKILIRNKMVMKIVIAILFLALSVKTWVQVGNWKNSLTLFSHAIDVTKGNDLAYMNLGLTTESMGRPLEAIDYYQKAIDIDPNYGDAHYNLATTLMHLGRTDEAIAHFKKALDIDPNKIITLDNLAAAYFQKNQVSNAIPLVQKALALAKSTGDETKMKELSGNLELLTRQSVQNIQFRESANK
jgi:tetratricopeptide (TPR) repeat protein